MTKILLGSRSPQREKILRLFHLPFEVQASDFDESLIPFKGNVEQFVCHVAEEKGKSLQEVFEDHLIITADTVVAFENELFFKPKDESESMQMLKKFSGKTHTVCTGVSVRLKDKILSRAEKTSVTFNQLTDSQIEKYLKTVPVRDKAGSYSIQELGSLLVASIEGSFYNVVGLPVKTLNHLLNHFGVDLWDSLSG